MNFITEISLVCACAVRWLERRAISHQNFVRASHILCDILRSECGNSSM